MRTIAFVTQKGGAGKSTLASSVAVAARAAGERVFVFDLDPLQTLVKWASAREASDIGVEHVPAGKLAKAISALEKKGVTLVIIDAPGHDGEQTLAAVRAAELCIIPARPNAFDLWASEKTRAQVKEEGCDYAFLLNQCPPSQQSARVELGARALQAMGGLLAPLVSSRVDYQEAARLGLGVAEYNPDGVAAQEMKELWSSIKRRLKRASSKPAAEKAATEKPASAPKTSPAPKAAVAKPEAPQKAAAVAEKSPAQEAKTPARKAARKAA
ncbi:AAA family ATPase [Methylocystis sp. MJC1]|jgi:chromosome partitioning protein|uniref:AAA family ATPase n=1 Tax=Methylocystis sp. MJC1 TaxID=2654282 RepID=UPI0013EBBD71|nr:AAA family ATPase [Methylocystis sp. MJC1]KAF2991963.1 Chromosome-partitioning ATPase Soj [Methylocystis sp. MJC1]MBU6525451.1 AAA family ATPase [Methylocystis sp. MJC1]UZX11942.1 AAA family ATPase [Methylocystis sp. MJC1]